MDNIHRGVLRYQSEFGYEWTDKFSLNALRVMGIRVDGSYTVLRIKQLKMDTLGVGKNQHSYYKGVPSRGERVGLIICFTTIELSTQYILNL